MSETTTGAAAAAATEPAIPAKGITVELAYATVAAFDEAVAVARKHPTFREFGEGKGLRVRATYQFSELDALQELKEATWELRQKRCWLDGAEIAWHEMAQMTHCFREYLRRPRREHCFFDGNFWSAWGCKYAVSNLSDRINIEWLMMGKLDGDGAWVLDKERIAAYVREKLYSGFHRCPAFDEEFLNRALELFPERIDPIADDRWRHVRNRQNEIIHIGPKDVDAAKKIAFEMQDNVRAQRAGQKLGPDGKRPVPQEYFRPYSEGPKKKGFLKKIFG